MTGTEVVSEIVQILVSGITQFGAGLASGIGSFVNSLAYTADGKLSVYFITVLAFAAVGICTGITTRIFTWLTSLGN